LYLAKMKQVKCSMENEQKVVHSDSLEAVLSQGYSVVGIFYHEWLEEIEEKEIKTHRPYNGSHGYFTSSSTSMDTIEKVITKTIVRRDPRFIVCRNKTVKILYGDTNETTF